MPSGRQIQLVPVKPAIVPPALATALAKDADSSVADKGRQLVEAIAGITDDERRWTYGQFGL